MNRLKLMLVFFIFLFPFEAMAGFLGVKNRMFVLNGSEFVVKGVWMEPLDYNWTTWWAQGMTTFEADVDDELGKAQWLECNVVQTIIDTASIQRSDFMLKFDYIVTQCRSKGIKFAPMLLGWGTFPGMNSSDYIDSTRAKSLIQNVVTTYKNDTTIAWWGIRHEGFNGFYARGFPSASIDSLTEFYKTLYDYIKSIDSNHLVSDGGNDIYTMPHSIDVINASTKWSDFSDFVSIQYYKDASQWIAPYYGNVESYLTSYGTGDSYSGLMRFLKSDDGADMLGKPILISEVGYYCDGSAPHDEYGQFNFFSFFTHLLRKKMVAGISIWSVKDRSTSIAERMYGLYDYSGNKRLSAYWYKNWSLSDEAFDIWK